MQIVKESTHLKAIVDSTLNSKYDWTIEQTKSGNINDKLIYC